MQQYLVKLQTIAAIFIAFIVNIRAVCPDAILNEPNTLKKELDNQSQSARMLLQLGSGIIDKASRALKTDPDGGIPEKETAGKSPEYSSRKISLRFDYQEESSSP